MEYRYRQLRYHAPSARFRAISARRPVSRASILMLVVADQDSGVNANPRTTISTGWPSVGGLPASSHRLMWTRSPSDSGTPIVNVWAATISPAAFQLWNATLSGVHTN